MLQILVLIGEKIYVYRFIINFLILIVLFLNMHIFTLPKHFEVINKSLIVTFSILFILLVIQVEVGSPITAPIIKEGQIEKLISSVEHNPSELDEILLDSANKYDLNHKNISVWVAKDSVEVYWSDYDFLKRDFSYYGGYGKRIDYPVELKKNGYFEIANNNVRVICYPVFYLSIYKLFSIYIPLKPGGYHEMIIIENGNNSYQITCEAETKYSLGLSEYIDIVTDRLRNQGTVL